MIKRFKNFFYSKKLKVKKLVENMFFVGIDLAWSEKNKTSIAIIRGDKKKAKLVAYAILSSNQEIIKFINRVVKKEKALIAIDAPLVVPNEKGRRMADSLISNLFRQYNAVAYPANRKQLSKWDGKIRGEELAKLLEKNGFIHSPYIKKFESTRKFFEVYPHPSMVVIFNLKKILQYKAKLGRTYKFRWREFRKYQNCLKKLKNKKPSLVLEKEITNINVKKLKGKKLKEYEDLLDAIFCAYIAYYCWANPEKCAVLGDVKKGYIVTPIANFMKRKLSNLFSCPLYFMRFSSKLKAFSAFS